MINKKYAKGSRWLQSKNNINVSDQRGCRAEQSFVAALHKFMETPQSITYSSCDRKWLLVGKTKRRTCGQEEKKTRYIRIKKQKQINSGWFYSSKNNPTISQRDAYFWFGFLICHLLIFIFTPWPLENATISKKSYFSGTNEADEPCFSKKNVYFLGFLQYTTNCYALFIPRLFSSQAPACYASLLPSFDFSFLSFSKQ